MVLVDGSVNICDLNKEMDWNLLIEGFKILNGLLLEYLEEILENKVSVRLVGYFLEIVDILENMIKIVWVMFECYIVF